MAIDNPPPIPNLTLPVPNRLNPEPFSERMDRTLAEIPLTVDGMNLTVTWMHQTALDTQQFKNDAGQSVEDAGEQVILASNEADRSFDEAERSKAQANKSESSAETAENAALVAQNAAGLPGDFSGLAGRPLTVNPEEDGTHFADVIWPYKTVSADYTAIAGDIIAADITSNDVSITLPAHPVHRSKVTVFSYSRKKEQYVLTVRRNGNDLMRLAEDMVIDSPYATAKLVFDQTIGWILYE